MYVCTCTVLVARILYTRAVTCIFRCPKTLSYFYRTHRPREVASVTARFMLRLEEAKLIEAPLAAFDGDLQRVEISRE